MITSLTSNEIGPGLFRVTAASDLAEPLFDWYLDGVVFLENDPTGVIELPVGAAQLSVQVFDQDGGTVERVTGSGLVLRWQAARDGNGTELAVAYRVEQWDGAAWVEIAETVAGGVRLYETTLATVDETTIRVRVIAVDASGGEATLIERRALVVRVPDVPSQSVSVDAGTVTIGA